MAPMELPRPWRKRESGRAGDQSPRQKAAPRNGRPSVVWGPDDDMQLSTSDTALSAFQTAPEARPLPKLASASARVEPNGWSGLMGAACADSWYHHGKALLCTAQRASSTKSGGSHSLPCARYTATHGSTPTTALAPRPRNRNHPSTAQHPWPQFDREAFPRHMKGKRPWVTSLRARSRSRQASLISLPSLPSFLQPPPPTTSTTHPPPTHRPRPFSTVSVPMPPPPRHHPSIPPPV